jgi:hypothetical protein
MKKITFAAASVSVIFALAAQAETIVALTSGNRLLFSTVPRRAP